MSKKLYISINKTGKQTRDTKRKYNNRFIK